MQSVKRTRKVVLHFSRLPRSERVGVICISDPPNRLPWLTTGKYNLWYAAPRMLNASDDPRRLSDPSREVPLNRVAFLIHKDIPRWSVVKHIGDNEPFAAILKIVTSCGPFEIHNVYNCNHQVDFSALMACIKPGVASMCIGDMNAHRWDWSGDDFIVRPGAAKDAGEQLYYAAEQAGMKCFNKPGVPTWSRKTGPDTQKTTIDLVFLDSAIASRFLDWNIVHECRGFTSDHCVHLTTFDMEIDCTTTPRFLWAKDAKEEARVKDDMAKKLKDFPADTPINCTDDLERYSETLQSICNSVIVDTLRPAKPSSEWSDPKDIPAVQRLFDQADNALEQAEALSAPCESVPALFDNSATRFNSSMLLDTSPALSQDSLLSDHDSYIRCADALIQQESKKSFWQAVHEGMRDTRKAFGWLRKATKWFEPKAPAHVDTLYFKDKNLPNAAYETCSDGASKTSAFRRQFWRATSDVVPTTDARSYDFAVNRSDSQKQSGPEPQQGADVPEFQGLPRNEAGTDHIRYNLVKQRGDIRRSKQIQQSKPTRQSNQISQSIDAAELEEVIKKLKLRKEAGVDLIPNEFLKLCKDLLIPYLVHLINACFAFSYEPKTLKVDKTVVCPKSGKKDYSDPKNWRPIALLPTIGKLLEKVMANRLKDNYAELLAPTQHGSLGKCTTKAVQCLLNPVYRGWALSKRQESTLLSFDFQGAYNNVNHFKLLKALEEKHMPRWIVKFIASFLSERLTTLVLPGHEVERPFYVNIGLPQGSPLSPILFLLFASSLLESFAKLPGFGKRVTMVSYADDTALLVTSESHKQNCKLLADYFKLVRKWADNNEVTFAPSKYEVMHFQMPSSQIKKFNSDDVPLIEGVEKIAIKQEMTVLGMTLDDRLTWKVHVAAITAKVDRQLAIFSRVSKSHLGPSLDRMRHFYIAKVRSIIAYGCPAWFVRHPSDGSSRGRWGMAKQTVAKLEVLHNKSLRHIAGGYNGSPTMIVRKETFFESIEAYLHKRVITFQCHDLHQEHLNTLSKSRLSINKPKSGSNRHTAMDRHLKELGRHPYHILDRQAREVRLRAQDQKITPDQLLEREIRNECVREWERYRDDYISKHGVDNPERLAINDGWGKKALGWYKGLNRWQSTMLFLCRVGHIGLRKYLHGRLSERSVSWPRCLGPSEAS